MERISSKQLSKAAAMYDLKMAQQAPADNNPMETPIVRIGPLKAYLQVFLLFTCVSFGNLPFYSLSTLQTTLNGVLGSVSTALALACWTIGSLLTQNIVSVLGLKVTIVSHHWLLLTCVLGYYYSSWPTLLLGNIVYGWSVGPALAAASVYANIIACSLAKVKGDDAKHYVGIFQGLATTGALYSGAVVGNGLSSVIFLLDESYSEGNVTANATNSSYTPSNTTTSDSCDSGYAQQTVSDQAYYILLGVCTVFQLISMVSVLGVMSIPGRTATCKALKRMCLQVKSSLITAFKTSVTMKYLLVMPIGFYSGLEINYVMAVYAKAFLARCLGIGFVGIGVMLYQISTALSSVAAAKIMVYTSRTVFSIFLFIWTMVCLLFIMFWTREPSYSIILATCIGIGVCTGSWPSIGSGECMQRDYLNGLKTY
jgi:hypothetical protein